jgi:hypothetical protein
MRRAARIASSATSAFSHFIFFGRHLSRSREDR